MGFACCSKITRRPPISFTKQNRESKHPDMENRLYRFIPQNRPRFFSNQSYILFWVTAFFLLPLLSNAQSNLQVTVQDGTVTTTCDDIFGAPDPLFSVSINGGAWITYPDNGFCFMELPNMQYEANYDCLSDVPATINVCFRVFEDDGLFCNVDAECLVEVCEDIAIPAAGTILNYTVEVPDGEDSDGTLDLIIDLSDNFIGGYNDLICDATDLGELPYQGAIGNPILSNYNNFCATNTNDPNPLDDGGFGNDRGVWFTFETGANASAYNTIFGFSDPEGLGDDIGLQIALYESLDGTCNNVNYLYSDHDNNSLDQEVFIPCLQPFTRYYILVDAAYLPSTGVGFEGYFGLSVVSSGIVEPPDFRCDADDLGMVPLGGNVGTPVDQSNYCATDFGEIDPSAFVLQRSVWYMFQAPETGHVIIELTSDLPPPMGIDPVDCQVALYGSASNNCIGPMIEITSSYTGGNPDETIEAQCLVPGANYWVVMDGSGSNTQGIFGITVSDGGPVPPQSTTMLDEVICDGGVLQVGDSTYTQTGTIEEIVLAANGCDSLIIGQVTVLDPISTTVDTSICEGESISVGNSVYFESGNYIDILTATSGCDSTVFTNLTVLEAVDAVAIQVQEASDQFANDGIATVNVNSGGGPFTYLWSNSATTQTISNLSPGLYCVTVTAANGCEDVACISVLYPGAINVMVQDGEVTCNGDTDGVLTITVSDGMPVYNYEWGVDFGAAQGSGVINASGGSASITNLAPGDNYTITITDSDGLIIVTSGEIIEPIPIVNNLDTAICFGTTLIVGSTVYDASGPILENLTTPDGCDSLVTGTLTVLDDIVTNLNLEECFGTEVMIGSAIYNTTGPINEVVPASNGCDSTITGFITILDEIVTPLDTAICFGEIIIVNGTTYDATGIYQEDLTASNGCDSTVAINLTVFSEVFVTNQLVAEASGLGDMDGIAEAIPSGGAGNYSYQWSHGPTTNVVTGLEGGQTYCVTITDDLGCTAEDCIVILFPVDIQSNFTNDTLDCPGDTDGTLTFTAFNGQAPYNYSWENQDGSLSGVGDIALENGISIVTGLPAGIYTIVLADIWGSTTFTIEIIEPEPIIVDLVSLTNASCFGTCDGTIEVVVSGGATPYTYQWSAGGSSDALADDLCADSYVVTVTDGNGCTATWDGILDQPTEFVLEVIELNPVSCNGGANGVAVVTTNGNPDSYLWSNGEITDEIGDLTAGVYTVTVTNSDGCTAEESIEINEPISPIISNLSVDQPISCNGADDGAVSIVASGGNNITFAWSNGATGNVLIDLAPGLYQVTMTDENGCEGFDEILLEEPSLISAEVFTTDVNCFDGEDSGSIIVSNAQGGAGGFTYSLNGIGFFPTDTFSNLVAGTYDVYVQDIEGCEIIIPASVDSPGEISVFLGDDFTEDLGEEIVLDANSTSDDVIYEWAWSTTDSVLCLDPACSEISFAPVDDVLYTVTVTDTLTGCSATDEIFITVKSRRRVYIPNVFTPNDDGINDIFYIYPGPAVNRIKTFQIYDRWGNVLFTATDILPGAQEGWDGFFKGKEVNPGVYVYYAEIEFIDGFERMYRGDVTVVK